jgi:diaminohydroxyphosphoribosylaminopyrimidine deaminase/5-amino-6-(5-phosphoribosylamino)uracil reductase
VSAAAAVFRAPGSTIVATTEPAGDRIDEWHAAGADVVVLDPDDRGGVSLPALLRELGKREMQGVLLEGGATLAWGFLRDGLVDRLVQYIAPMVLGGVGATPAVGGEGFAPVGDAARLSIVDVTSVGPDIRVEADVHRDR